MKNITKILVVLLVCMGTQVFAQGGKTGHVNMELLIHLMPERDSALVKLSKYAQDLDETMQGMQAEWQTKLQAYQQKSSTWTAAVLEAKQKDLQDIQARIEQYNQSAQRDYAEMQQSLFTPIAQKANEAIQKIGKENGLVYIFDISASNIPYVNENLSLDVLPLAKKELGIPADKTVPTQIEQQPAAEAK